MCSLPYVYLYFIPTPVSPHPNEFFFWHISSNILCSFLTDHVYVFLSPLISNHYSMTALGSRNFCLFHFLRCLSIYNCAWNIIGAQQMFVKRINE